MPHISGSFTGSGDPPSVVSASMTGNVVAVTFSEPMNVADISNASNYTIVGMTILSAAVRPKTNDTVALLTVTGFTPSTEYTVVVSTAVKDKAGNNLA